MKERHYFIIPASLKDPANAFSAQIGIDPEGRMDSFTTPLVPSGGPDDSQPTHYYADGQMTEAIRGTLDAAQENFPGAMWWRVKDAAWGRGEIVATNTADEIGSEFDLTAKLAELSLTFAETIAWLVVVEEETLDTTSD